LTPAYALAKNSPQPYTANMKTSLSYVLVTPYAIAKGRTGGILSRLLSRTNLDLVGAQMLTVDETFAKRYAAVLRNRTPKDCPPMLADYAEWSLVQPSGGTNQVLLLLFRGENPCEQLAPICYDTKAGDGNARCGTIRDTFGDFVILSESGMTYFEPAVLTADNQREADEDLRMMAAFLKGKENLANPCPPDAERTLVIIKPDNWTFHSARPGAIIDIFSGTGLGLVGVKIHHFSLAQALDFYGPVAAVLKEKLSGRFGKRARELLEREFGFPLCEETAKTITDTFGADCAANEFAQIVEFMSGKRPGDCPKDELGKPGDAKCMILVYEGENAVAKIRTALGPTNPADALDGTVRREFGQSVMVNAAHASDSAESFLREKDIIKMEENTLGAIIKEHLG